MKNFGLIIDGKKIFTDKTFDVRNPATGEIFAQCPSAELAHLDQAVAAAQQAFVAWSQVADAERKAKIHALADLLEQHTPELMELLTRESGKPLGGYQGIGSGMELVVPWPGRGSPLS